MADNAAFDAFYAARAPQLTRHIYLGTGDRTEHPRLGRRCAKHLPAGKDACRLAAPRQRVH